MSDPCVPHHLVLDPPPESATEEVLIAKINICFHFPKQHLFSQSNLTELKKLLLWTLWQRDCAVKTTLHNKLQNHIALVTSSQNDVKMVKGGGDFAGSNTSVGK